MLSVNQKIGRYRVLSTIGAGGMGEVFLAQDMELDRLAAIKILPRNFAGITERVHRFIQEAKSASALNHPNILTIYEIGLINGTRFIASEYIKGETLRDKLKKNYLKLTEVLEIALQIASALDSAHSNNIIHRDIKPENIMIRTDGLAKILDFGLAKLSDESNFEISGSQTPTREHVKTQSGMILGTFAYMSPEQARAKPVDFRADIFSLGVVLYEMLTGIQPFYGETSSDIIAAILMKEPENPRDLNPEIPEELENIVLKALSKNPEDRYQTAKVLHSDLKNLKLDLDFEQRTSNPKHLEDDLQAEARTEIIENDTSRIARVITQPVNRKLSSRIPFFSTAKITEYPAKHKYTFVLIPFFVAVALVAFFFYPAFSVSTPKPGAVKLYEEGSEALREGTFYKAGKLLEEAVKTDGNFTKARAALADAWMELDYFGRAQTEVLKINELENKNRSFFTFLSQTDDSIYFEAVNATVLRDFPKAVNAYQKLAARNTNSPHAYMDLGRAYEKNEEIDKAFENYEKASVLNPQYGAAFLRMGILQRRKSDFEKSNFSLDTAEQIFDRQSNDEAIAEVRLQRGISLNLQEKTDDARSQFQQVINMPRANSQQKIRALQQISSSCAGEGKTDCAEEFAANAVKMAQDERMENVATNGLIDLGNAFLARGDYEKAEKNFRQALVFAQKDEGLRNEARAFLSLGSLRIQQKKPEEAEDFTKRAVLFFQKGGYNKELAQANLILGRSSEMRDDFSGALQSFEQVENSATAAAADRAYAKMVSGNILMRQEKYPDALHRFEQSFELYKTPNSSFYLTYTLFYLSDVLAQMGRFDDSRSKLSEARNLLKEGDSLLPQLEIKNHLLNAQIALSRQNFPEAVKEAKQVSLSPNSSDSFDVNVILCTAQSFVSRNILNLKECSSALNYALEIKDQRKIHSAKLALARAYLNIGDNSNAIKTALEATDYFESRKQQDSNWQAWLIAAQASRQVGDREKAREFSLKSLNALNQLRTDWGQETFDQYISKPNLNNYFKQLEELSNL